VQELVVAFGQYVGVEMQLVQAHAVQLYVALGSCLSG